MKIIPRDTNAATMLDSEADIIFYVVGIRCQKSSKLSSGWLKEVASENIHLIFVTLDTFHLLSGWLKDVAPRNICSISITFDTFQWTSQS